MKQAGKKYFIKQYEQHEYLHGGVGAIDAEKILASLGFVPVSFPDHFNFSLKAKINRVFFLFKIFFLLKRNSVVVFLFPVYARMNQLLLLFLRMKGIKLICLVMDIEGLRDADKKLLKKEIRQLKRYSHLIVHNNKMKSLAEQFCPRSVCSILSFFDFLARPVQNERSKGYNIVFAGNLDKSKFLLRLDQLSEANLHFNIYGPAVPETALNYKNITYHGIYSPYDMPSVVQGSFGLIWDGESIDGCTGSYGEYLRYNSQHKLSLYILSGLPVIIWEEAATAELVKEYKIGFTVKNLFEIKDKIDTLSNDEYRQMQTNMKPLAERISKGQCLGTAVAEIMRESNNQ